MVDEDFDQSQADDSIFKEPATEDMDIYEGDQAEEMESQDEIDEVEEGFMKGYEGGEKSAKCAKCSVVLEQDIVEEEIDGESYRFCSDKCATEFEELRKKEEEE